MIPPEQEQRVSEPVGSEHSNWLSEPVNPDNSDYSDNPVGSRESDVLVEPAQSESLGLPENPQSPPKIPGVVWIPIDISAFKPREFTPEQEHLRKVFELGQEQWKIPTQEEFDAIPWKGHFWEKVCMKDAMKRGRNLGSMKDRIERSVFYVGLAVGATAADVATAVVRFRAKNWIDKKYPEANKSILNGKTVLFPIIADGETTEMLEKIENRHNKANSIFAMANMGMEYTFDSMVNGKVDEMLSKVLNEPGYHYASKLAKNAANIGNIVGSLNPDSLAISKKKGNMPATLKNSILYSDFANAPFIEGAFRIGSQIPLFGFGRGVEWVYDTANAVFDNIDKNPTAKWWEGLAFAMFNAAPAGSGRTKNCGTSCAGGSCSACR